MKKLISLAAIASLFVASQASAIVKHYDVDTGSVTLNTVDPGLVLNYSLDGGLGSNVFDLDDGDSVTFDFFNIWTTENSVDDNADQTPKAISAELLFSDPTAGGIVTGETYGIKGGFFGNYQAGVLEWAGSTMVVLADRIFDITLSNEIFNEGYFWGTGNHGAVVEATVTQLSSSEGIAVSDSGSTLALLGLGVLGLAGIRRRMAK